MNAEFRLNWQIVRRRNGRKRVVLTVIRGGGECVAMFFSGTGAFDSAVKFCDDLIDAECKQYGKQFAGFISYEQSTLLY